MWENWIHNTRTGSPEQVLKTGRPVASARWNRVLGSKGSATHGIMLRGSGLPKSLVREITRGNKYTIVQRWGDHVSYAGVIQNRKFRDSTSMLTLSSRELRAAILGVRNPFGVNEYDPANGVLNVTGRSWTGALRAVLLAATKGGAVPGWELPIDIPADVAGGFNAVWRHEDKLSTEHLLKQLEDDGVEIDFAPYVNASGYLRYAPRIAPKVVVGSPFMLAARAPASIVLGLDTEDDATGQRTGLLGFGKGQGQDAPHTFAPRVGDGIRDLPVMDASVTFPRIDNATRLESATDADFARKNEPVEQWNYSLYIGGVGAEMAAPGSIHDMHVFGSDFIEDGSHPQRVISLSGDMRFVVKPGVQAHG